MALLTAITFLAALLGGPHAAAPAAHPEPPPAPAFVPWIRCTPESFEVAGQAPQVARNPIARALEQASPGSVIRLDAGSYPAFSLGFDHDAPENARARGGTPERPITVEGIGMVRILRGDQDDTIAIDQAVPSGFITFKNVSIHPGKRSAIRFEPPPRGRAHRGFAFVDCHILGNWEHETGKGDKSKYGVWAAGVSDFFYVGVEAPAYIERLRSDDAFHFQDLAGNVTITNVRAARIGGAFCRVAASDAPGKGELSVKDCRVSDVGLSPDEWFKAAAAFTVLGAIDGTLLFENNTYQAGFEESLTRLTLRGQVYGTGAFACQLPESLPSKGSKEAKRPVTNLVLRDNAFRMAPGTGDRPVVAIAGASKALLLGANRIVSGGAQPALALDPADASGRPAGPPNESVFVAPETRLEGSLTMLSRTPTPEELNRLRTYD